MNTNYNEQALESLIEQKLVGICTEVLKKEDKSYITFNEDRSHYTSGHGYYLGHTHDYDKKYAIDTVRLWHFLEATQGDELEKLKRYSDWQLKIIERLDRVISKNGVLHVLKKGIEVDDACFTFFYEYPNKNSSRNTHDYFRANEFSVTRQLQYSTVNPLEEVDLVIFINGLPIMTMELKNPLTGQTAAIQGQKQYRETRDVKQTLFNFGRCIVHFAVDTEEVYMTTKLQGKDTYFLPFNKGNNYGKGNPVNLNGHRSSYLWEEVLSRPSLANIIQHFVLLEGKKTDSLDKKFFIFPRYHQLDVVNRLIEDVSEHGAGKTYLIQHSAGSGKSNSITWAAFKLIDVYEQGHTIVAGNQKIYKPLYDTVIVVTDRRILDKQIRDNIRSFSQVSGLIAPVHSSSDLRLAIETGKRIVITTIQKFPFIVKEIGDMSDKRFAIIIDEAHSSQSGTTADSLNYVIGNKDDEDNQDLILKAMKSRKMSSNASYFAFTATPKNSTLERFGEKQGDGSFKPFHLYSMKQAIEEGFILDVLSNYTTYKSYYKLEKSIEDNPMFDSSRAQKRLKSFVERDPRTIKAKAKIMLEHFISKVYNTKKLKNKAKGMVLTQSIVSAIQYYQALNELLEEKGNPFRILIAFSGEKEVKGIKYTESGLNGFSDTETATKFDEHEYRLLVVADKYLTGFDQPKLTTMYIDKKLQNVLCVQALSRLNRAAPKYGKRTEDLFVLDFFNEVDDIQASFEPFYTSTVLSESTDINVLHDLKEALDESGIYEEEEVELFSQLYFNNATYEELIAVLNLPAERFNKELELEDEVKADYKIKTRQFIKIYSQVAAILEFNNVRWEKLYWFLKYLIPFMIVTNKQDALLDELLESVDLSTYGLQRMTINEHIVLDDKESSLNPQNPNARGVFADEKEEEDLETILADFNKRFFNIDGIDESNIEIVNFIEQRIVNHPDFQSHFVENNDEYTIGIALQKIMDEVVLQNRNGNVAFSKMYNNDRFCKDFFDTMFQALSLKYRNMMK
ncbi:type I restriction-modification system, restriction subunit R [Myroides odoratimimus]|uniref:type I restriction endonuclease subunit R n=1 Tax=Myroides odoratimimus TaxID=76832 RepID=UPI000729DE10|nr:type I restriction endonuclease [Myroides odoratimimus]GAQ13145.1 type I restriction-modification system, restriction subunit R [Myroides odoratimimus]STZ48395.1 Type-1 restriction enzyme R protein [Myroides odoratimimus]